DPAGVFFPDLLFHLRVLDSVSLEDSEVPTGAFLFWVLDDGVDVELDVTGVEDHLPRLHVLPHKSGDSGSDLVQFEALDDPVSCRPEHLVNSCVLCSPVTQMVQLVSNNSLSLVLINHRDISVISKRGYLTVNRRTGIMIDLGVAVFVQTVWFALLSLRVALHDVTL
ncbi:unnamed protein product, partial [Porites evermanni]